MNAILNGNPRAVKGSRIYSSLYPCNECCKLIIQSGITKVVYSSKKNEGSWEATASERMFRLAGVEEVQYTPDDPITIDYACGGKPAPSQGPRKRSFVAPALFCTFAVALIFLGRRA